MWIKRKNIFQLLVKFQRSEIRSKITNIRLHYFNCRKKYSVNFTEFNKTFCLSLHYKRANSYLFFNGIKIRKFKAKYSKIVATSYLGNFSKDYSVDNIKKVGLNGYVYDFNVIYDPIEVNDILDIHKYLMKENYII